VAGVVAWGQVVFYGPSGAELAAWVIQGPDLPDLALVDALARWQLSARRAGGAIGLREVREELRELLDLVGLGREVGGQAEGGEQVGVEEGVVPGDPVS
jgi:hypothetical protein